MVRTTGVQIRGLDRLIKRLLRAGKWKGARRGLMDAGHHVKGKISRYPPSTEANRPKSRGSWYERGYGTRYQMRSGQIRGRRTSETLGRKWTVASRNGGLTVVVGNNVSYGPFVQSFKKQARFHKSRGWPTDKQTLIDERRQIQKLILEGVKSDLSENN